MFEEVSYTERYCIEERHSMMLRLPESAMRGHDDSQTRKPVGQRLHDAIFVRAIATNQRLKCFVNLVSAHAPYRSNSLKEAEVEDAEESASDSGQVVSRLGKHDYIRLISFNQFAKSRQGKAVNALCYRGTTNTLRSPADELAVLEDCESNLTRLDLKRKNCESFHLSLMCPSWIRNQLASEGG
jgi:hypothetical protein